MHVPCWNLPRTSRLLAQSGVRPRMETAPGYLDVVRAVTTCAAAA
jgi:fatty acid desaturase